MTNRTRTDVVLANTDLGYKYTKQRIQECFVPRAGNPPTLSYSSLNPHIEALIGLVRAKFSGEVDIYPVDIYPTGWYGVAIRPHSSNICTAIASWGGSEACAGGARYTIHSLRVRRGRKVAGGALAGEGEAAWLTTGMKDCKRAASFIAGLLPYTDTEMAAFVVRELGKIVQEDVDGGGIKLARAFVQFRYRLDGQLIGREILEILDCIAQNKPAYIPENGELFAHYNKFAGERKQLEEKGNHVGELAPMFMFRAARNNTIVVVASKGNPVGSQVCTKSYNSFDDLPQGVKRVVMTLEVKEKDSEGRVEGLGIVANKAMSLCNEACGFAVPIDTLNSFILEAEGGL